MVLKSHLCTVKKSPCVVLKGTCVVLKSTCAVVLKSICVVLKTMMCGAEEHVTVSRCQRDNKCGAENHMCGALSLLKRTSRCGANVTTSGAENHLCGAEEHMCHRVLKSIRVVLQTTQRGAEEHVTVWCQRDNMCGAEDHMCAVRVLKTTCVVLKGTCVQC